MKRADSRDEPRLPAARPRTEAGDPAAVTRRDLLAWGLAGLATVKLATVSLPAAARPPRRPGKRAGAWSNFESVPYPVPLSPDAHRANFERFDVRDDLVVPPGFTTRRVIGWGDTFRTGAGPARFGTNCDHNALIPIAGTRHLWLVTNHEAVSSLPWLLGLGAGLHTSELNALVGTDGQLKGQTLNTLLAPGLTAEQVSARPALRQLLEAALDDLGVSAVRLTQTRDGALVVDERFAANSRFGGRSAIGGTIRPATGPARRFVAKDAGTFANCSGGQTSWGTALSCEENIQDQIREAVDCSGRPVGELRFYVKPGAGLPNAFRGLGVVLPPDTDTSYGWVVEIDPDERTQTKHTALGRFHHENVALRARRGEPLRAWMGDDRRGGHVWRFTSRKPVRDPGDRRTRELLNEGTLCAARFRPDGGGRWIPLTPDTPITTEDVSAFTRGGMVVLPDRRTERSGHVAVGASGTRSFGEWRQEIIRFAGTDKPTLRHLVHPSLRGDDDAVQAILLTDAFAMANAVGATPASRPEDLEVLDDGRILIAFTDHEGRPGKHAGGDTRIFRQMTRRGAAHPANEHPANEHPANEHPANEHPANEHGALVTLRETGADTFEWAVLAGAGHLSAGGAGFVHADNLALHPDGGLWFTCDIGLSSEHAPDKPAGVFGSTALFRMEPGSARLRCFATGPVESELTGPRFTPDGRALIVSVQHPGEGAGPRQAAPTSADWDIPWPDGTTVRQRRTRPIGSSFDPHPGRNTGVPVPTVMCVIPK